MSNTAKRRLALVAFGDAESPWMLPKGNESGIAVTGLGEGEQVILTIDDGASHTSVEFSDNLFLFPIAQAKRFKVAKRGNKSPNTVVEVLLNGQAHRNAP